MAEGTGLLTTCGWCVYVRSVISLGSPCIKLDGRGSGKLCWERVVCAGLRGRLSSPAQPSYEPDMARNAMEMSFCVNVRRSHMSNSV